MGRNFGKSAKAIAGRKKIISGKVEREGGNFRGGSEKGLTFCFSYTETMAGNFRGGEEGISGKKGREFQGRKRE